MAGRTLKVGNHRLVRIYIGDNDKYEHKPLAEEILNSAREMGMAGCTVIHGPAGFGALRELHTAVPVETADDLPVVLELVDTAAKTKLFLERLKPLLEAVVLVTEEQVRIRHSSGKAKTEEQ